MILRVFPVLKRAMNLHEFLQHFSPRRSSRVVIKRDGFRKIAKRKLEAI